jgi:NAD(P)-dependent dehydrogenase (short-subunit alcohol dehydrogenase family)
MDQGQPGGLKPGEIERYALPIEQANPTVWLCSDWASYITGATLPVDGGATASL